MDFTAQMTLNHGQDVITQSVTIAADAKDVFGDLTDPIALPPSSTVNVSLNIDPDALKAFMILSTVDVTLTTTNSSGAADVVSISANEPLFWYDGLGWANGPFANRNPWTNLAFQNAGATAGELRMLFARDGTP